MGDREQRPLIRKMQLAIVRADGALVDLALLVGLRPSDGLYEELAKIIAKHGDGLGAAP